MLYIILYRYRSITGKWKNEVVPTAFDSAEAAMAALPDYCDQKKSMGWIAEVPQPDFKPPFKLVDNEAAPADQVLNLGKIDGKI